jgi:ATP-binding cassette, subfamily B (MDR/TAP), member 1
MPIVWFDNPRNNAGSLTARLSSDCNSVNGLTTTFVAIIIQNSTTLIAGITIGFLF